MINICTTNQQTGEETYFKLNKTTRMSKVFNAFAASKGVPAGSLRFLLDGQRVNQEDTPITLGLEDQDELACMVEQPWTGPWNDYIRACLPGYHGVLNGRYRHIQGAAGLFSENVFLSTRTDLSHGMRVE